MKPTTIRITLDVTAEPTILYTEIESFLIEIRQLAEQKGLTIQEE